MVRNRSAQLPGLYFVLVFLIFTIASFQRNALLGLSIPVAAFSFAFVVRSPFAGYLEVSPDTVKVRTMFRTRTFNRKSIESVMPIVSFQYTTRVFPVITFKDQTTYKLSEFFSQRRSYKKHPESSIVTKTLEAFATERA